MGLDLRVLPFDGDFPQLCFSHTVLGVDRCAALFEQIDALPSWPVPEGFASFTGQADGIEDTCYGDTTETPFGQRTCYVFAGQLAAIPVPERAGYKTRATWAYLRELPPETKVAVYWY